MEDANIKEVNIEISDINDTQDEKNNEVTLNEADSGSQYIQLKNSETLNISKNTETENNKDEIYFKKLNESEDNNGQEQEITKGSEKSNKEQSERFENSDRELFEKIIVRNEDPFEEYTSENYSLSKCQNITTIKYEGNIFSYLTNPDNSEDFFFIKLNQLHQFELMDKNLYKNKFQKSVKIPYNQLKLFVDEMNISIKDLNTQIKGKKLYSLISNIVKFLIVFSIFVLLAYFIYFYGEKYFNISENANKNIFYAFLVICFLFLLFILYSFTQDLYLVHEICKLFLLKQEDLERIVYNWNNNYFMSELHMNCMIPITFPYIFIILNGNKKLYLEDHEIYD